MEPVPLPDAAAILDRLTRLHPRVIDLSLGRMHRLLAALGHPERRLPPVVHVAGTNGKGSTIACLRSIVRAAGFRAHVYTSPHLVRFNERIVVADIEVEDDRLAASLDACERANAGEPITFFEITTAAALLMFADTPADYALLETGLGGRLDATNVLARPAVTALSPISLDHQSYLGDTLAAIAGEKAGILKPDVPCVSAEQAPEAADVVHRRAAEIGAPLREAGRDWTVTASDGGFHWEGFGRSFRLPAPSLAGVHQLGNAGLAIACALALPRLTIDEALLARALAGIDWPARLQRLEQGRLASLLPKDWELWLDGGHNPAAGQVLASHIGAHWRDRPLFLIVGMLGNKDAAAFLSSLVSVAAGVFTVPIPQSAAGFSAEELARLASRPGLPARAAGSVAESLREIAAGHAGPPARVLICGSLYLAGAVLAENAGG